MRLLQCSLRVNDMKDVRHNAASVDNEAKTHVSLSKSAIRRSNPRRHSAVMSVVDLAPGIDACLSYKDRIEPMM